MPAADVFVLDDGSPDGTGEIADAIAATDPQVRVVHRAAKEGLGKAYLAGFAIALDEGYDAAVEMDADGSHLPEQLPLAARRPGRRRPRHRRPLGARRRGAQLAGPPQGALGRRERLHQGAARHARQRRDGRLPRLSHECLAHMGLAGVQSQGYCFQIDLTLRALRAGLTVVEVPITFVERQVGVSKMGHDIVREALTSVTRWGVRAPVGQLRGAGRPGPGREPVGDRP